MDLSAVDSLDEYLKARHRAECKYLAEYSNWRDALAEECFDDLGMMRLDSDGSPHLIKLVEFVGAFSHECLRAYARQIGTGGPLVILDRLESHRHDLLREVKIRKWVPAAGRLRGLLGDSELEDGWGQVEGIVDEWLWDVVQPRLWLDNKKWHGGTPVIENAIALDEEADRRRQLVGSYLERLRDTYPGEEFSQSAIWIVAGYGNDSLFKAWKRNSSKATKKCGENFERVLSSAPAEFMKTWATKKAARAKKKTRRP